MEFWDRVLTDSIYTVDYEKLVVDQEEQTRKLIRYIGLEWEDKCLSPHENNSGVATASNLQVRQGIYQGSSQQWKKYEAMLNGAFDQVAGIMMLGRAWEVKRMILEKVATRCSSTGVLR